MSYSRDRDAHTRGAGAIAAVDRPGSRQAKRALGAAMSRARDAQRAALTYGARGGLGAINTGTGTGLRGRQIFTGDLVPGVVEGGNPLGPLTPPERGGGGLPPVLPPPGIFGQRGGALVQQPRVDNVVTDPAYPGTTPPRRPSPPPFPGVDTGGRNTLPPPPQTGVIVPPPKSTVTIVTGGGSGGAGLNTGGTRTAPITPIPPPMEIPDAQASSSTPWMLIGAVALGAWLLLGDHKDEP